MNTTKRNLRTASLDLKKKRKGTLHGLNVLVMRDLLLSERLLGEDTGRTVSVLLGDETTTVRDRVPRGRVLIQDVDGLEGETLRLGDAEVREDEAADAGGSPDEKDLDAEVCVTLSGVDQVGSGIADTEVPEPVRRGGHRHGLCADVEREDLAGDDPRDGPPRSSENAI